MLAQLESGVSVGVGWGLGRLGVYAGEPSRHHGWERGLFEGVCACHSPVLQEPKKS